MNLPFKIALRFVRSKKYQSVLIIVGFAIGISTNIFIGNLISSIEDDLIHRTIDSQAHITIKSADGGYLDNFKSFLPVLESNDAIRYYTKILEGRAFITNIHQETPDDIIIRGMSGLDAGAKIFNIVNDKFEGSFPSEPNQIIIGQSMATSLGLQLGDMLNVSLSPMIPLGRILYVTGIFDVGQAMMNDIWLIGDILMAGMVLFAVDKVTSIAIQVNDYMQADRVAEDLRATINRDDLIISSWKDDNEALLSTLTAQSISTKLVQFFILLSVSIAIGAMLSITVVHKQRQIGILKAMGLNDQDSYQVFLLQGLIISTIGTILGVLLGLFYIGCFNYFGNEDIVTIRLRYGFTLLSVAIAITAGLLAALFPARTSRDIAIIDIIRRN